MIRLKAFAIALAKRSFIALIAFAAIFIAQVSPATALINADQATLRLSPVLERVVICNNQPGFNAIWGYRNDNNDSVYVPIGTTATQTGTYINKIDTDTPKPGQPNTFATGRQVAVFGTYFLAPQSVWSIRVASGGRTATAGANAANAIVDACQISPPST